ncbi:MAG: tyrosine-type recombinase/integrase [Acaryochloris sp. CRU_2_0]|nr:tyrosine-type recombinase/integrase [Acaryochloris sp. CRU_2_0]
MGGFIRSSRSWRLVAGVKDSHPHRGRHTVATEMVSRGMDPLLARQITRHKSEKSFERYSKRALQKQAEEQFCSCLMKGKVGQRLGTKKRSRRNPPTGPRSNGTDLSSIMQPA